MKHKKDEPSIVLGVDIKLNYISRMKEEAMVAKLTRKRMDMGVMRS